MPCTYESIVFLLANGTDLRALEIMLKLRNESRHYIRRDFNEFKMMLVEDYSDGSNIFKNGNSRPLFLVLLLRLLNVLLTSNCIYWMFLANIWFDYQYWNRSANLSTQMIEINNNVSSGFKVNNSTIVAQLFIHSAYAYKLPILPVAQFLVIVSVLKILVGVPFLCFAEKFQVYRNRIIFKVTLCVGVINLIFFVATLVCNLTDDSLTFTFYIAKLLSIIYSFYMLIAFAIDTIGYCELGESFSLTKRYGCIAFIAICEYIFYALAILLIMNALFRFYFHVVQSVVICFICYALLKWMPNECLNCTLRSARDKHFVKMANANN